MPADVISLSSTFSESLFEGLAPQTRARNDEAAFLLHSGSLIPGCLCLRSA